MVGSQCLFDKTPLIKAIRCRDTIASACGRESDWVSAMMIDRRSEVFASNMTAFALHQVVRSKAAYTFSRAQGLVPCFADTPVIDPDKFIQNHAQSTAPDHIRVLAHWNNDAKIESGAENILGDNVTLSIDTDLESIEIPVLEASPNNMLYYGAMLFHEGDRLQFNTDNYPIWKMELGQNYVNDFLMTDAGKGFYFEWHLDRPHWHQPLTEDACGFYLLAKNAGTSPCGKIILEITGFKIPVGSAVYTTPGAIHCDAALTGENWIVGFTDSESYSTALLRNNTGSMLRCLGHRM